LHRLPDGSSVQLSSGEYHRAIDGGHWHSIEVAPASVFTPSREGPASYDHQVQRKLRLWAERDVKYIALVELSSPRVFVANGEIRSRRRAQQAAPLRTRRRDYAVRGSGVLPRWICGCGVRAVVGGRSKPAPLRNIRVGTWVRRRLIVTKTPAGSRRYGSSLFGRSLIRWRRVIRRTALLARDYLGLID
jgi:hypothetical protein